MVCTRCGIIGADARPNWRGQPQRESLPGCNGGKRRTAPTLILRLVNFSTCRGIKKHIDALLGAKVFEAALQVLKSDEFSSVFLRPSSFGDGRRPIAL
jgi:hypothetical protein